LALILDPRETSTLFVRWIEGRGRAGAPFRNVLLAAAPVEPGELLRSSLFSQVETAIVTSATLAVGGTDFRFLRGRLGLGEAGEARRSRNVDHMDPEFAFTDVEVSTPDLAESEPLQVTEKLLASPFDYASQTLFCVPTDLPGHDAGDSFQEATARVVLDLVAITDGGIFVLFTSHRALRSVARLLRVAGIESRNPVFVHGEAPRARLLGDFVRSERGILLGTSSFWEGVDVPGEPLRGLILQKIPFRVPTEPITQARMEAIEGRGESSFHAYLLPLAALRLKQGFGRLVRSRDDRGAVILLDSRILTRRYGRVLRRALPDAPLSKGSWEELRRGLSSFYAL
jgi:ATP-dependent DNA helicase DinG